jgi:hypothetical protein
MAVPTSASSTFLQVVRQSLIESSTLSAIVGGRVFDLAALDPDRPTGTYPAVVLNGRGGGRSNFAGAYQEVVFELWALSKTSPAEASDAYDAAFGVLQAQRLAIADLRVVVCQETSRPEQVWVEENRAWAARGRWVARSAF